MDCACATEITQFPYFLTSQYSTVVPNNERGGPVAQGLRAPPAKYKN